MALKKRLSVEVLNEYATRILCVLFQDVIQDINTITLYLNKE